MTNELTAAILSCAAIAAGAIGIVHAGRRRQRDEQFRIALRAGHVPHSAYPFNPRF